MSKKIIYALIAYLIICMTAIFACFNVSAASASLWFTDPGVIVGNNVSVVVDIKGDNIGGYQMNISYDSAYLEFVSATGNTNWFSGKDNGGVIAVSDMTDSGSTTKMSFTLTFKTKKTGVTKLTPSEYKFFDGGGDPIYTDVIGDSTISINAVPAASSDATLKSLSISSGTLTPEFSAAATEYTATVDFSVTSLVVSALKNHNGATVYVNGNETLAVGENTITVSVTAENGAKNTYTIKVTRAKNPLSTGLFFTVGEGISSEASNTISPELVPAGFDLTKITVDFVELDAIYYDENGKAAVYLLGSDTVAAGLYFVDFDTMTAAPFEYLGGTGSSLLILDIGLADAPKDYELGKYIVGGTERDVFIPSGAEEPNHCLVYAIGTAGEKTLYIYDPVENTYQRYNFAEMGVPETTIQPEDTTVPQKTDEETEPNEKNEEKDKSLFSNKIFKYCFIGIAVLIVVLVIVAIVLGVKYY